jgi:hypothetical protein
MDIEQLATSAVTDSIAKTDFLSPFINSGDKEPSWDGHIYVYKNKKQSKDNLKACVPVQVKGKKCDNISVSKFSYSVEISDLKNYLNDGGVIFFVVLIQDGDKKKIFYADLLPVKLKPLLSDQKTKSIELKEFPTDNNHKLSIFLNFVENQKKQASFTENGLLPTNLLQKQINIKQEQPKIEKFTTTFWGIDDKDKEDPIGLLFKNEFYFYAHLQGIDIPIPLDSSVSAFQVIEQIPACIAVKGIPFYNKYTRTRSKDGSITIKMGQSLTIELNKGKTQYSSTENLKDIVVDLDFIIHVFHANSFEINDKSFHINPESWGEFNLKEQESWLAYLKKMVQVLDYLNVKDDIIISKLTDEDKRNFKTLITAFVEKQPVRGLKKDSILGIMEILTLKLLLVCIPNKDNENNMEIYDFFQLNNDLVTFTDEDGKQNFISQYVKLGKNDYLKYSNIRYNTILFSFQRFYSESNTKMIEGANKVLLDLLSVYDENTENKTEIWQTAKELAEWLLQTNNKIVPTEIYQLNLMQVIRRERELTKEEKEILTSIALNNQNSNEILFGANLLLGYQEFAEKYFGQLDTTVQEAYKQYPIYKFWKTDY